MTTTVRFAGLTTVCLLWAAAAGAQTSTSSTTSTPPQTSTPSTSSEKETRPATTTFFGDTGLWFLPTGEVLPHGKVSVSGYRRGTNWIQGYTNVGDFAGTVGVGLGGRAELFGSFLVDTRIDRDVRPLFLVDNPTFGGIVDRYPRVTQQWTGDNVGDLYVGAKVNLWSEYRQNPAAFAIRGIVKAPTGKKDAGVSTGKADVALDAIISHTYRWTAPTGTLANPAERQTLWTAPQQEGSVPVTVTVNDGKGGTASDTVNIQVVRPTPKTYTFEDVHFDFDRYTLRPEATRVLDEAVAALREDPTLRVTIEGHTCNIGTAEYNLALGDRRANAVKDYLVSRGVTADRLQTVSYGEERPKYDNAREETRRLNRRAALVVNLQR